MTTSLYERLTQQMEAKVNTAYIDEDIMGALGIPAENLGDISIDKWMHKNLDALPEAALSRAGYHPNDATLFAEEFGNYVWTAAERIIMNEKDWTFAEKHGISTLGIESLGKMVGKGASRFFMTGRNGVLTSGLGAAIEANYNFLLDEGSGAGTLARPLTVTSATGGAWSTWANAQSDILNLVSLHEAANYNLSTSVLLYPKAASKSFRRGGAATREASPMAMALEAGVRGLIGIPNQYMVTVANALPVIGAFDMALVDLSKIKIGYTRPQRTRVIAPHDEVRSTTVECEVWFAPYFEPQVMDVSGTSTVYKGVTTITAINGT